MIICLYGSAIDEIDKIYLDGVEDLFEKLAHKGHSLVFGAGKKGEMGAAARGMYKGGGVTIGVLPRFMEENGMEPAFEHLTEKIMVDDLQLRKRIMEEKADAFIIAPGGVGTYDEFFEALTLRQLGRHNKPILLFNINGFYDPLEAMMVNADRQGFLRRNSKNLYKLCGSAEEIIAELEK